MVIAGAGAAVTVSWAALESIVWPNRVRCAWPVAVLVIEPLLMSVAVATWLAVQVTNAPGARAIGVFGQLTLTLLSVTV